MEKPIWYVTLDDYMDLLKEVTAATWEMNSTERWHPEDMYNNASTAALAINATFNWLGQRGRKSNAESVNQPSDGDGISRWRTDGSTSKYGNGGNGD